jgi:4-hydroxy-2-oxoheptanedioate aldolase
MTAEPTSTPPAQRLRSRWNAGDPVFGLWTQLGSSHVAELAVAAGYDYVCVDLQHGLADERAMAETFRATGTARAAPLARVAWNDPWLIMRALDLGAAGVIVPMVGSGAEAARAVQACRFPPRGIRSYGPIRAQFVAGSPALADVAEAALSFVMIETREGLERLEEIASTPGLDGIYIGPSDLSIALGLAPGAGGQTLEDAVVRIRDAAVAHGLIPGMHCYVGAAARARAAEGFKLVTVGVDSILVRATIARELAEARGPMA